MASLLLITMLALPWLACLGLIGFRSNNGHFGRGLVILTAALISLGCLALVMLQLDPSVALGPSSFDDAEHAGMRSALTWSTDRFSLVMVMATMIILAAAGVLLPEDSPSAWMLTLMVAGGVLQMWWLQHVWWVAGVAVLLSFLALVLPVAGRSPGMAGAARGLWLATTVGDLALILALVAGVGGLGDGLVLRFSDPDTVREFAVMRPATGMFVAFWWWLGVLGCAGQFPLCVKFDAVRSYRPLAWVVAVGLGVFAVGWRLCDLGHAWWAASPSVFNLIVSGALASALLCAWFALCTADFRVRMAYLTAAHISLALGPLSTGNDVDRIWASAVVMGTLGLAVWCWCVVTTPAVINDAENEPAAGPSWARIMTGGEASTVVWQWSTSSRPPRSPMLPTIAPFARAQSGVIVLLWCGLSIAGGSWWWGEGPFVDVPVRTDAAVTPERLGDVVNDLMATRPNGSIPVSALAVALSSAAVCAGMRTLLLSKPDRLQDEPVNHVWVIAASAVLGLAPTAIIAGFARPSHSFVEIGAQCSPALACLALAAMVTGWVWAGWPLEQQQKAAASFAVLHRLGERRLLVPGLLQFGANFPLRGLAQMFRFLDWSVLEVTCWGGLRQLPHVLRRFADELRQAGNGSYALVIWASGTALVTTILWLAQTAR